MAIEEIGIIGGYDVQQYLQFNPEDSANWYMTMSERGKRRVAMYPTPGRQHIEFFGLDKLRFALEPRGIFAGTTYAYIVVGAVIYRVDEFFNTIDISGGSVTTVSSEIRYARLVIGEIVFACFVDGQNIYVYQEDTNTFSVVTDTNAPSNPTYMATFGDRLVVAGPNTSQFRLSKVGLDGGSFDPTNCFTFNLAGGGTGPLANRETNFIRQFGVLHNTLYIFTDFTTGIWSNNPSVFTQTEGVTVAFPWKKNTTQDWDYGIAAPNSLDTDFGMMVFLGKNKNGSVAVMASNGGAPQNITTKAIDILFRRDAVSDQDSPFVSRTTYGFLYEEDNTIFYRLATSTFDDYNDIDIDTSANSIEYNFETKKWHRLTEYTGDRNRAQRHMFFAGRHLVSILGEGTVYELSGQFFTNEEYVDNVYTKYPFRYERITPILSSQDYSENITDYVQIDFSFGDGYTYWENPFPNTTFIISDGDPSFLITEDGDYIVDEALTPEGEEIYLVAEDTVIDPDNPVYIAAEESTEDNPVLMVTEGSNVPALGDVIYRKLFKPRINLFYSNDGGVTYEPADVREFSQLGAYQWRMRWYELGPWRNRNYKLVCTSPKPIVILGAVHSVRRASGGAN